MPRNRSEKKPEHVWVSTRVAILDWARAVKHGESVGLDGSWFGTDERGEMNHEQDEANVEISRRAYYVSSVDIGYLEGLTRHIPSSNTRRIAMADIVQKRLERATQS